MLESAQSQVANAPEITYVKWRTPGEELSSTALIVAHLTREHICRPRRICVAVPNRTWAIRMREVLDDMDRNTVGLHTKHVKIAYYNAIEDNYDWLFLMGCVDGFIPPAQASGTTIQTNDEARAAWGNAFNHATKRVIASSFAKADATFAKAAGIQSDRRKMEHGRVMAMCKPTPFLRDKGRFRPSTVGGQALLRSFNLN
ncbi:hypothetical protein AAY81_06780 [Denitrobacterium detoxificans]|uniref:Uncharacterized protein n=1 Tax=Denitrobacterium detoxificans TaxID=79604 RepID=A0A172RYT5_9ACTN|nr:hypothetical protein [Denitrobacterium detoxificans]ANE22876.1 hypothetical protein AAY81_06780 [Denitrobacterium detoxificans]SEO70166.1 hypothetical protein SAMN02910314_00921 [Denitrobacterium detoxificans]